MKLERGINLGGYLSQCVHSTEHYDAFIQEEDIRKIASMGFDHVRLAIDYEVLEDEYGRTREEGFAYVTRVVEWCKRQELNIVLDLHKAYGYDFNNAGDKGKNILFTNKMVQKRFVNLWIKIAEHYANETHVAFELLNEVVEQENAEAWNLLIAETVDAIRRIARDTIIIYGGIQWNSVKTLKLLEKPKDENILFTSHFMTPSTPSGASKVSAIFSRSSTVEGSASAKYCSASAFTAASSAVTCSVVWSSGRESSSMISSPSPMGSSFSLLPASSFSACWVAQVRR